MMTSSTSTSTGLTYLSSPTTSPSTGKGSWTGTVHATSPAKAHPQPRPLPSEPGEKLDKVSFRPHFLFRIGGKENFS